MLVPQLNAKPDMHAYYVYDEVKMLYFYYMKLGSTGEHPQLLSIRLLPPEWSSRKLLLIRLKHGEVVGSR